MEEYWEFPKLMRRPRIRLGNRQEPNCGRSMRILHEAPWKAEGFPGEKDKRLKLNIPKKNKIVSQNLNPKMHHLLKKLHFTLLTQEGLL